MVLIDTSAWIEFFRRDGKLEVKLAMRGLLDDYEATLCGPVEMEFLGGAPPRERDRLQAWLNVLPYVRNSQRLWRQAADTFSRLRQHGLTIPWNDSLIATIALGRSCRVYAIDKHFTALAPIIGLRLYEPGYGGMYSPEDD
jgi:predicted nucleic acid-binding protein